MDSPRTNGRIASVFFALVANAGYSTASMFLPIQARFSPALGLGADKLYLSSRDIFGER